MKKHNTEANILKWGVILILLFILLVTFSSCQSIKEREQKRCQKHYIKSAPCRTKDSIWITDSIKGWSTDTIVKFSDSSRTDTLILEKNGVVTKTVVKWKERTIEQQIIKRDTVYKKLIIRDCPKCPEPMKWYQRYWWAWFFIGMMVLFLFIKLLINSLGKNPDRNTH